MIRVLRLTPTMWGIQSSSYSNTLYAEAKRTPGMAWNPAARVWAGYADAVAVCVERCRAKGLRIQGDVGVDASDILLPVAYSGLWDYQKEGVEFLIRNANTGCLLADTMGLGKTPQALIAARAFNLPTVVICPNHVRGVWEAECKRWWPAAYPPRMLVGTKTTTLLPAPLTILHYDIAHAWATELARVTSTLVLDECHALMSERSRRSSAVRQIARGASRRIGLSGTPLTNRPRDLWNVVDTLSEGRFGRAFHYFLVFCNAHKEEVAKNKVVWKFDGSSNEEELRKRLAYFMLRRTKEEVHLELPPFRRQIVEVEITRRHTASLPGIIRGGKVSDQLLRKALDLAADGKLDDVVALTKDHVDAGERIIVFTYRRAVAEYVADALRLQGVEAVFSHGGIPQSKRDAIYKTQPQVLACTIDTTSTGINLSYAQTAIFAELTWEPHELLQAEARLHRPGQVNPVIVKYVIAKGTVDEIIRRNVVGKLDTFAKIVGDMGAGLQETLENKKQEADVLKSLYSAILKQTQAAE